MYYIMSGIGGFRSGNPEDGDAEDSDTGDLTRCAAQRATACRKCGANPTFMLDEGGAGQASISVSTDNEKAFLLFHGKRTKFSFPKLAGMHDFLLPRRYTSTYVLKFRGSSTGPTLDSYPHISPP